MGVWLLLRIPNDRILSGAYHHGDGLSDPLAQGYRAFFFRRKSVPALRISVTVAGIWIDKRGPSILNPVVTRCRMSNTLLGAVIHDV